MLSSGLPKEYSPFDKLEICSNLFKGTIPIKAYEHAVVLIGRGAQPLIWLSGLVTKKGKEFKELVKKNHSLNEAVKVIISTKNNSIVVKVANIVILEVTKVSEEKAIMSKIDLRPIGLNIYGDVNRLMVGTNSFIHNTITAQTMVNVGN